MNFEIISLFPNMFASREGLVGQAMDKGLIGVQVTNPRDFTEDVHKTVDDRPYGGGDGMLMLGEPLQASLESIFSRYEEKPLVVYTSPQGEKWSDEKARELSQRKNVVIICGRYGGIDQRIINRYVDREVSIGDYVLSGGELAANVMIDSMARFIPGVLGNPKSPLCDSFSSGVLEYPQFTRPRELFGESVPEFLLSGNHAKIAELREALALVLTHKKRPDLLGSQSLGKAKKTLLQLNSDELKSCGLDREFVEGL